MAGLLDGAALMDCSDELARNIVSLRHSQEVFDDLADDPDDLVQARTAEVAAKPPEYNVLPPAIQRPFQEARWFEAIGFPFENWRASRFSAGHYGVWYGAFSIATTVHETVYHWYHGLLSDAEGFAQPGVAIERKVYWVVCDAALVDVRPMIADYPVLVASDDYSLTQQLGARLHHDGHPGLVTRSARYPDDVVAVFTPNVLSSPRPACFLTYRLTANGVDVERETGNIWFTITRR